MTSPLTNDSFLQDTIGNRTSDSGLVTYTAANQLSAAMQNPHLVTGNPADNAKLPVVGTPAQRPGVPNPYGLGIQAYEPNTEPYIADASTGAKAVDAAAGKGEIDTAASPAKGAAAAVSLTADEAAQTEKDLQKSQAQDLANAAPDYAGGGAVDATGKVQKIIQAALQLANSHTPYVWGGTSASGVDCSGLIYYAARAAGVDWKRYVAADYNKFPTIDASAARPGDIVYWSPGENGVGSTGHVGIYLGNGNMVVAPQSGQNVQIEKVFGTPTYHRVFSDASYGTATTAVGGSTYNYAGQPYSGYVNQRLAGGTPYGGLFVTAGQKYGIPAALLAAVAHQESGFNPMAVSSAGAQGLMQFMPGTAAGLGVNAFDPASAVDGAARYLSGLYSQFGSWDLALAAYNAGPGAVRAAGGIPSNGQTQNYVSAVQAQFQTYSG